MVQRMIVAVVKVKKIFLITKFWIVDLDSCCSSLKCLSQDMFVISGKLQEDDNVVNNKFWEINQELKYLYIKAKQMQQTQLQTHNSVTEF